MQKVTQLSLTALIAATTLFAAEDKKAESNLARVVITKYSDVTGTKNFGYMPGSLTEAIDSSLQTRFEYHREDPDVTEKAVSRYEANKGRLGEKTILDFCKINKSEIVILGSFAFDDTSKELVVVTSISLCRADGFRTLPERRNKVDPSIFKMADKVADDIVRELTQIAKEQAPEKQAAAKKGEKIELKKEKPVAWSDVKWSISPSLDIAFPLNSSFGSRRSEPSPFLQLTGEYRFKDRWHLGLVGGRAESHAGTIDLEMFHAAGFLGYNIDLSNRWRLGFAAGGGYYAGKLSDNSTNCSAASNCAYSTSIRNPYATARVSLKFLIFQWLSVGAFAQQDTFFDGGGNMPLFYAGGGLVIGAHF